METNDLCAQCACKPVCGIYRAVGPTEKCHFYCQKKRSAHWELGNEGRATCSGCNSTQKSVWSDDYYQSFCGVCGAEMSLEGS